jgi:hypothetical protein
MGSHVIAVPKSVTVRTADDFKTSLIDFFAEGGDVVLDLAATSEVDLSFVQIVEAARVHLAGDGRQLRLARSADGAVAALLGRAGFLTDPDPAAADFWFHGDLPR